jgi:hypothetical protein
MSVLAHDLMLVFLSGCFWVFGTDTVHSGMDGGGSRARFPAGNFELEAGEPARLETAIAAQTKVVPDSDRQDDHEAVADKLNAVGCRFLVCNGGISGACVFFNAVRSMTRLTSIQPSLLAPQSYPFFY